MQDNGGALQSQSRIHRRLGQRLEFVFTRLNLDAVVLHEDQIPDLHRRVARAIDQIGAIEVRIFRMLAEVIVDFRVWDRTDRSQPSARNYPCARSAEFAPVLRPPSPHKRRGFVISGNFIVAAKDGEPQSLGIEVEFIDRSENPRQT